MTTQSSSTRTPSRTKTPSKPRSSLPRPVFKSLGNETKTNYVTCDSLKTCHVATKEQPTDTLDRSSTDRDRPSALSPQAGHNRARHARRPSIPQSPKVIFRSRRPISGVLFSGSGAATADPVEGSLKCAGQESALETPNNTATSCVFSQPSSPGPSALPVRSGISKSWIVPLKDTIILGSSLLSSGPSLTALHKVDTVTNMRRDSTRMLSSSMHNLRSELSLTKSTASFAALKSTEPSSFSLFQLPVLSTPRTSKARIPSSKAVGILPSSTFDFSLTAKTIHHGVQDEESELAHLREEKEDLQPALGFPADVLEMLCELEDIAGQVTQLPLPICRSPGVPSYTHGDSHIMMYGIPTLPLNIRKVIHDEPLFSKSIPNTSCKTPKSKMVHVEYSSQASSLPTPTGKSVSSTSRIPSAIGQLALSTLPIVPSCKIPARKRAHTMSHTGRVRTASPTTLVTPAPAYVSLPTMPAASAPVLLETPSRACSKVPRLSAGTPKRTTLKSVFRPRQSAPAAPTYTAPCTDASASGRLSDGSSSGPPGAKIEAGGPVKGFEAGLRKRSQSLRNLLKLKP
ncbi:hypothetical protein OBBRIDRAFT_890798 [Obba rivulosa]|uniref:Uncharacterized protein n=1 Tax=Obba rivulosa TaxID=1052685 RepID=A0A8E2AV70_9APHY|nr:hypothetical protein OBBRIDRAFT_890798 [Obba rivulosa]